MGLFELFKTKNTSSYIHEDDKKKEKKDFTPKELPTNKDVTPPDNKVTRKDIKNWFGW